MSETKDQRMGQPCPQGQIPVLGHCVLWSAPSAMVVPGAQPAMVAPPSGARWTYPAGPGKLLGRGATAYRRQETMKTLFRVGIGTPGPWLSAAALGQVDPYVSELDRNRFVSQISAAIDKVKPIEDLIVWSQDNDPGLRKTLGADASRFFSLSNSIGPLYKASVAPVYERMRETDAEFWYAPSDQEYRDINTWVTGINEMDRIYQSHRAAPMPEPTPEIPRPAPRPGAMPTTAQAPAGPMILGIPQNQFLVGSGLAVGLGILIYAIS